MLCSALVSQQQSYNTILRATQAIYEQRKDGPNLAELAAINKLDTNSLAYRTQVFKHASANGFFTLRQPNELARQIYSSYQTDSLITRYVKNQQAVATFWQNKANHTIDVTPILKRLRQGNMPIYALYGKEDGLYSPEQIAELRSLLGPTQVRYLENGSHTVFIDQQALFLAATNRWLNKDRYNWEHCYLFVAISHKRSYLSLALGLLDLSANLASYLKCHTNPSMLCARCFWQKRAFPPDCEDRMPPAVLLPPELS